MDQTALALFKQAFSGEIITPDNDTYESARAVYAGPGSPALVVRPEVTDDVALAVNFAKNNSLTLSVRGGGHHGAGFGTNDGGMVIDLSLMNAVDVYDTAQNFVRIAGGAKWGDIANTLHEYNLAISSGDTKSVGVGGLTLSGGIGWMVRKWGMTIDSLVGVEVVVADGSILHASESENPDLFWAIRGGGGNFGIVTHFEFVAHPINEVYFSTITYDAADLPGLIRKWRDYMATAPTELSTSVTLMPSFAPEMPPSAMLLACYAGDNETAALKAVEPLQQLGNIIKQDTQKKAYSEILQDAHPPGGMRVSVNNILTPELSDALIDQVVDVYTHGTWVFQIRSIDGALNSVPSSATAFAHRDSKFMMFAGTFSPAASPVSALIEATKPWEMIAPFAKGSYANFLSARTDAEIAAIYPMETREKLAIIKRKYDPQNLFDQNYNIKPAS